MKFKRVYLCNRCGILFTHKHKFTFGEDREYTTDPEKHFCGIEKGRRIYGFAEQVGIDEVDE